MKAADDKELNLLLGLAPTAEDIDKALTEIGGCKSYEDKVQYLEDLTGSKIVSRSGGGIRDDFWAIAEGVVNQHIRIPLDKLPPSSAASR